MILRAEVTLRVPLVERVVDLGALACDRDLVVFDVDDQLSEQGSEEILSYVIRHPVEQFDRVGEHVDVREYEFRTVMQAVFGVRELLLDRARLHRYLPEPFPQLVGCEGAVGGEFDESVLLPLELLELRAQCPLDSQVGSLELGDGLTHLGADGVEGCRRFM